jgi:hypothetical protein
MQRRTVYGVMLGAAMLALSPVSPLFWKLAQIYNEPRKQAAMRFCESLVPLINAVKAQNGRYPETINPDWFKGKKVPDIIRLKHFYTAYPDSYILYFWNPGDFWDDFWAYDSRGRGGWVNYDANRPKD